MPTLTPTPSPTPTSSSTTKPSSPATSPPTSSPGSTEAPQLSPEEQAAQQEFEACAEWYADQVANVRLTGVITPELLEQWADAYDEGAGLAADGDPIAANQACQQLRSEMQPLLGAI